jgi:hypothetical protein
MPSTMTLEPPASIRRLCEMSGVYPVCVAVWGEAADPGHEHGGRVLHRGDIALPRSEDVPNLAVNLSHNSAERVGVFAQVTSTPSALWAAIKLGRRGRELVEAGHLAVSAETDDAGRLSGLALVDPLDMPGLPSARVWVDRPPSVAASEFFAPRSGLAAIAREADIRGGRMIFNPQKTPVLPQGPMPTVIDAGAQKAEIRAQSITAAHEQVEADRRRHEERMAAFAAAEAEQKELLLVGAGVPMSHWPKHTAGYQRWRAHEDLIAASREADRRRVEDQLAAERAAEERAREAAGIRELVESWHARELVPAEPTAEGVPWWRRLFRPALAAR